MCIGQIGRVDSFNSLVEVLPLTMLHFLIPILLFDDQVYNMSNNKQSRLWAKSDHEYRKKRQSIALL